MASCGGRGGGGGGACQSNCSRSEDDDAGNQTQIEETVPNLSINGGGGGGDRKLCSKCGEMEQDYNGMCTACFRSFLFGKFKLAVTSNAMISPTDNVLVAFSGGPASRVALQFIHEMQCKALKSWDASKSQALPVFGVGVAFIDESAVSSNPSHEVDQAFKEIRLIVSDLGSPRKELHITPIECIYSLDCIEGRNRLKELLLAISDATGKEDFLQHLRISSLQKIALENNYNKLMLGSCTSRIARHILSSTVKGLGYSLPADLQYVDSRWEVPIVLPLRDCVAQELRMLCFLDSLKTQQLLDRPSSGINDLVSLFVARLQIEPLGNFFYYSFTLSEILADISPVKISVSLLRVKESKKHLAYRNQSAKMKDDNPSRERTIVRTAEKLKPFCFNKFVEHGYHDFLPSRLRPKFQNVEDTESNPSEHLCPICGSPLSGSELESVKSDHKKSLSRTEIFVSSCCQSCCFQILPKESNSLEYFYSLLPGSMTNRVKDSTHADNSCLREQIKDCLLSDDDDGS